MNRTEISTTKEPITPKLIGKILGAFALLLIGFKGMEIPNINYIGYTFLAVSGFLAYLLVFGLDASKNLFRRPKNFKRYGVVFIGYMFLYTYSSSLVVTLVSRVMKITLTPNAASDSPWWWFFLIMPIALLGEEIFSITIFDIFRKKLHFNPLLASLISAIIFGLIHYTTYLGSNALFTIIQVILLQGGGRIILNRSYQKSGSIKTSWFVHYFYDLISFGIGSLF